MSSEIKDPFKIELIISRITELQTHLINYTFKLPLIFSDLVKSSITYFIMAYIFLFLYDKLGFEKTIIILLVGVVSFAIRKK